MIVSVLGAGVRFPLTTYQIEQKCVTATTHGLLHTPMWYRRCGIHGRQHEIQRLAVPPLMPTRFVRFPFRHPLPLLISAFRVPIIEQPGPDWVTLNILYPKVVKIFEGPGNLHIKGHLPSAGIVGLASAKE